MRARDEQAHEEQQRRELGREDGQTRQRLRHEDAEVRLVGKEGMAHQRDGAGDEPHRHRHEERVVGQQLARVVVGRSRREQAVLLHEHARQEQAERDRDGEAPEQRTLQRLGALVRQEPEVEERGEEVPRQHDFRPVAHRSGSRDRVDDLSGEGREVGLLGRPHERLLQRIRSLAVEVGHAPLERDPP